MNNTHDNPSEKEITMTDLTPAVESLIHHAQTCNTTSQGRAYWVNGAHEHLSSDHWNDLFGPFETFGELMDDKRDHAIVIYAETFEGPAIFKTGNFGAAYEAWRNFDKKGVLTVDAA